jgi:hypothetical protein
LIADPLNCTLRRNNIFHFFLTNFDFSLYINKLTFCTGNSDKSAAYPAVKMKNRAVNTMFQLYC